MDVEVELQFLERLGGGQYFLEGAVHVRLDFFEVLDDLEAVVLLVVLVKEFFIDDVGEVDVEVD